MDETLKKSGRGGARAGAGRKAVAGREKAFATRISLKAHERLTAYARERGVSLTEALNSLLEAL